MLILGDDGGDIFILRFLRPTSSLFKKLVIDRKQVMLWQVGGGRELNLNISQNTQNFWKKKYKRVQQNVLNILAYHSSR